MKRWLCVCLAALCILSTFSGCGCTHEWTPASCTSPKQCALCGVTEGEPLGHKWIDATCSAPKTCSVCGAVEGEALAHTSGAWETLDEAMIGGDEICKCTVCGQTVETRACDRGEKKAVDLFAGNGLPMTAAEFRAHFISFLPRNVVICTENRRDDRTWFSDGSTFSVLHTDDTSRYMRIWYAKDESFDGAETYKQHIDAYFDDAEDFLSIAPYFFEAVDAGFAASEGFSSKLDSIRSVMNARQKKEYAVKMTDGWFVCRYQPDYEIMGNYYTGYYEIRFLSDRFYQEIRNIVRG